MAYVFPIACCQYIAEMHLWRLKTPVMVWILQDLIDGRMKEGLQDLMLDLEAGQSSGSLT